MSKQRSSVRYVVYIRGLTYLMLAMMILALMGCGASYVTPGAGADLSTLAGASLTDKDIQKVLDRKPVAPFPAHLATVRIQAPYYRSYMTDSYGSGRYSVVTVKEIETDKHFEQLARLPMIRSVAPLNQILLPTKLESDKELRVAAANLHADLLLVYTLHTVFRVRDHDIGPLGIITLGFLPNHEAKVTSTASAVLFDVRTGFVYGLAESTAREKQMTNVWTSQDTVDESRIKAESRAFEQLLDEFKLTWKGIVEQYAATSS
ncbi:MAG: hypothetical protein ACYSTF_10450 [Planctomycetota bacterium]